MTPFETSRIENAGRGAFAWAPEADTRRPRYRELLAALVPAVGIIAVATSFLVAIS